MCTAIKPLLQTTQCSPEAKDNYEQASYPPPHAITTTPSRHAYGQGSSLCELRKSNRVNATAGVADYDARGCIKLANPNLDLHFSIREVRQTTVPSRSISQIYCATAANAWLANLPSTVPEMADEAVARTQLSTSISRQRANRHWVNRHWVNRYWVNRYWADRHWADRHWGHRYGGHRYCDNRWSVTSTSVVQALDLGVIPSIELCIKQLRIRWRTKSVAARIKTTAPIAAAAIAIQIAAAGQGAASGSYTIGSAARASAARAVNVRSYASVTWRARRNRCGYGMTRLTGRASRAHLHQRCR